MTSWRSRSSRVLVPVVLAVAMSAILVPALGAPQSASTSAGRSPAIPTAAYRAPTGALARPTVAKGGSSVVDHWPPYDDDLYGPHFITASPSGDTWYEDFFSTHLMAGAKYYIKVNNPAPGGPGAVGNFSVMLNGVYVADPGMMEGQPELVKEVPLQAWNAIQVWTAPGTGQLRVMITTVPMTHMAPAWAELVKPDPGQTDITKTWQVTVPPDAGGNRIMVIDNGDYDRTGRIGEREWGEVKINGVHAATFDTLHLEQSKLVVPVTLPNGTSTIEAALHDAMPGAHIYVRVMYADTAKPKLVVTAPANNAVVSSSSVTVSGTYEDPMWGSVNVGASASSYQSVWLGHMAGVQPWSVSHPLNPGPNTIKIWARDGAANTSDTVTRVVTRLSGMTVLVQGRNPGVTIERDECLTIAAGDDAAYECGDLRLIHAVPATRTMNRERAPTLIYNSNHARPGALVATDVSVGAEQAVDSLEATVTIKDKPPGPSKLFAWSAAWSGGPMRRIVVPIDARQLGLTTGAYSYTLEVKARNGASIVASASDTGTVAVVDRSASPFGAGWWLAGLEQLVPVSATQKLWVGGDGSTRLYTQQGTSTLWLVKPEVDRVDSLVRVDTLGSSFWRRKLRNGGFVEFDNSGRHIVTQNRQKHRTTFAYTGSALTTVTLPVSAGTAPLYTLNYASDVLTSVEAPARPGEPRTTMVAYRSGTRWVEQITDPDGRSVGFKYDGAGRIVERRNRRDDLTFYAYDEAELLRQVTVEMVRTSESPVVIGFCAAEGRSLGSCASGPQLLEKVYTLHDGPRDNGTDAADTTAFYVNRFGGPDTIVNALGHRTRIERKDARFPLLVTALVQPNGFRTEAFYNPRALLDSARAINPLGDSRNAVTSYAWDPRWDAVARITSPSGQVDSIQYDAATGNRLWQQAGQADTTRWNFTYTSENRLETIKSPKNPPTMRDSVGSDDRGNVDALKTPKGFLTRIYSDYLGRDSSIVSPTDSLQTESLEQRQTILYDLMNRVVETTTIGPATSYQPTTETQPITVPAQTLKVVNGYDEEGNLTSVDRSTDPESEVGVVTTTSVYDAAHRKRSEIAPGSGPESFDYDPAGNLTSRRTRRGHTLRTTYDALNRPIQRVTPEVTYSGVTNGCSIFWPGDQAACTSRGYRFPYHGNGVVIPADIATFGYDAAGNLTTADNYDARIARTYNPNGSLATDTLRIRRYTNDAFPPFQQHVYGIRYAYDLSGRRTSLFHPTNLADGCSTEVCEQHYTYNALTDRPETVVSAQGSSFAFRYDGAGRLIREAAPGSTVRRRFYDGDSRLVRRIDSTGFRPVLHDDAFRYDARAKVLWVRSVYGGSLRSPARTVEQPHWYDALGALVGTEKSRNGSYPSREDFKVDGAANVIERVELSTEGRRAIDRYHYHPGSDRVNEVEGILPNLSIYQADHIDETVTRFDPSGNVDFHGWKRRSVASDGVTTPHSDYGSRSYYGADEKLRVYSRVGTSTFRATRVAFEEYRYDALGRRVLARSRGDSTATAEQDKGSITRFVWDAERLLQEARAPGGHGKTASALEVTSGSAPHFGTVGYAHGPEGLDHPLAVAARGNLVIVPHTDWRGSYDAGTNGANGSEAPSSLEWPGSEHTSYHAPDVWEDSPGWAGSLMLGKRDESGLLYMRNRYYDPRTGRFTQEDPIGLAGGLNLYGYAEGDPVNFSDPFGLFPCCIELSGAMQAAANVQTLARTWGTLQTGMKFVGAVGAVLAGRSLMSGGSRLTANRAAGQAAERRVAAELVEEGNVILGSQVTVRTSAGRRVIDHLVQRPDATMVAVEVKSGGATRTAAQLQKDALMATEGATIVGKNAPQALRGQTLQIPTIERR